jgi:hypothetical protein
MCKLRYAPFDLDLIFSQAAIIPGYLLLMLILTKIVPAYHYLRESRVHDSISSFLFFLVLLRPLDFQSNTQRDCSS